MANNNRKVRLKKGSDTIYPRTTVDNIVILINGSTESPASLVTLDEHGKVPASLLPSYVDDVVEVYGIYDDSSALSAATTGANPTNPPGEGKHYIDETNAQGTAKLVSSVQATGSTVWTWDTENAENIQKGALYIDVGGATPSYKVYRFGGNHLVEISAALDIDDSSISNTSAYATKVPSARLVAELLAGKQDSLTITADISGNSTSTTYVVSPKGVADYFAANAITCEDIS